MLKQTIVIILISFLSMSCSKPPAEHLELKNLAGKTISLGDYKGKTLMIDFWATWCAPCRESFPWMNEMQAKYKNQGLEIVAISLDQNKAEVEKFLTKIPAKFTVLLDPTSLSAKTYRVVGMPMSYIFNTEGVLIEKHIGFNLNKTEQYEASIVKALKK